MTRLIAIIALCLVPAYGGATPAAFPPGSAMAPLLKTKGEIIPDEYIVVFKEDVTDDAGECFYCGSSSRLFVSLYEHA